ncbi:MAG TPA: TIGR02300 family protein [Xanthobacteraceae bacterium]|nr:TIGR02300 family protein [Xanthobacteraceae bacterium]
MAKPELGTKRLCASCGAKFYDLSKTPITCPKCHTVMEIAPVTTRPRPEPARAAAPVKEVAVEPETQDAEFVSLEDADAEASGKKVAGDADVADDDIEIDDEPIDDAALIEEQEESDDDVTDIIGEREDNEEEP